MRQNYLSEQVFEWAGVGAAHVRATVFYENLRALSRLTLAAHGAIRLPWGDLDTLIPLVAGEDVARVAAGLLTKDEVPAGSSYPVIGAVVSLRAIVETFGRVLEREVRYEEISDEEWRANAFARGLSQHAVEHLSNLWRTLRTVGRQPQPIRFAITDTIETLGGRKPKTLEAFVQEERGALDAEASRTAA
jgi:uncharacterized protein YbjT (DUF2867 family)